jgi:hypothetical protein
MQGRRTVDFGSRIKKRARTERKEAKRAARRAEHNRLTREQGCPRRLHGSRMGLRLRAFIDTAG